MSRDDVPAISAKPESSATHASTRVTIAFPFSNINLHQPHEEVRELAAIVVALSEELAEFRPSPGTTALVERAHALMKQLEK
jgi:hypothetical protein